MPIFNAEPRRGDLWVKYTVAFPESLTEEQKAQVKGLLGGVNMPAPDKPYP